MMRISAVLACFVAGRTASRRGYYRTDANRGPLTVKVATWPMFRGYATILWSAMASSSPGRYRRFQPE